MQLPNSLLIELPLGSTAQVLFGDQSILRGKKILTVLPTVSTFGSGPGGGSVYSLAGQQLVNLMTGATLTLKTSKNHNIHDGLPLRWLYESAAAGHPLQFGAEEIDWAKSYVTVPPGSAGAGTVIQLSVIYQ